MKRKLGIFTLVLALCLSVFSGFSVKQANAEDNSASEPEDTQTENSVIYVDCTEEVPADELNELLALPPIPNFEDESDQTSDELLALPPMLNVAAESDEISVDIPIFENGTTQAGKQKKKVADINFKVNSKTNVISWNITMKPGYTFKSFAGAFKITDITAKLSSGLNNISGKSGKLQVVKRHGHEFYATVSGTVLSTSGVGFTIPSNAYLKWKCK